MKGVVSLNHKHTGMLSINILLGENHFVLYNVNFLVLIIVL